MIKKNLFVIFGTTRGLGASLVRLICARPQINAVVAVNRKGLKNLSGSNIRNVKFDLSKKIGPKIIENFFLSLRLHQRRYSKIFLICNASTVQPIGTLGNFSAGEVTAAFFVNVLNYYLFINELIKITKDLKNVEKRIAVISSGAAVSPHHGLSVYCGAKAAVEMMSRCIFLEQKELKQVKISAIRPGVINTDMQKIMRSQSAADFRQVKVYQALREQGKLTESDVAANKIYNILINRNFGKQPIINVI